MPRQALWLTALRRNHVNIVVAGILAAECDELPVWRKLRVRGWALKAGQPPRHSSGTFDHPDVVRVRERDLRSAHGRRAEQPRTDSVRLRCRSQNAKSQQGNTAKNRFHRFSLRG